mgnify:CR=1 FL=1
MKRRLLISMALAGLVGSSALAQDTPTKEPQPAEKTPAELAEAKQARQIADLVDQLGAEEYKVREQALKALIAVGPPALAALEKAKQSKDPEVAAAAAAALKAIRSRHNLPKKAETQRPQPRGLQERDFPEQEDLLKGLQPMPGQEDLLKQLEGQFPEMRRLLEQMRGGKGGPGGQLRLLDPNDPMFKDLFQGRNPFQELFGEDDQEKEGTAPRTRTRSFTWSNVPGRSSGPSGVLGVRFRGASPVLASQLSLPAGQGLVAHQFLPKSFAQTQGLQRFDILLEVDGQPIRSELDLRQLVAKGGKVTVIRKGKRHPLTFTKAPAVETPPGFRPRRVRPTPPRQAPKGQAPKDQAPTPKKDEQTRDF